MHRPFAIPLLLPLLLLLPLALAAPAEARSPARPGKTVPAGISERDLDPVGVGASMANFIRNEIVARFKHFKNRVDVKSAAFKDRRYTVKGELFSDGGRPMDLLSDFIEAIEGSKAVRSVMPRHARKCDDDGKRVEFELLIDADPEAIPWDPTRLQSFAVKVPADRPGPTRVKVTLKEGGQRRALFEETKNPGETALLTFKTSGPAGLAIEFDGLPYRTFDLE